LTNALAIYATELITAVNSFMIPVLGQSQTNEIVYNTGTRGNDIKTYYIRNLQIFVIS